MLRLDRREMKARIVEHLEIWRKRAETYGVAAAK
jgi:hypothetical protein